MNTRTPPASAKAASRQSSQGLMLRDEADAIIDNLKRQLDALQHQLSSQRKSAAASQQKPANTPKTPPFQTTALMPQVVGRLGEGAAELASRLEKTAQEIPDPTLRKEIAGCQIQAGQLHLALNQIPSRHQLLEERLSGEDSIVSVAALAEQLAAAVKASCSRDIPVRTNNLPDTLSLSPACLFTMVSALSAFASEIFTDLTDILLQPATPAQPPTLEILLQGAQPINQAVPADVIAAVLTRPTTSQVLVDLLYIEKILDMRNGNMGFSSPPNKIWVKLPLA